MEYTPEEIKEMIIKMHEADDAYGAGFYNSEKWRKYYDDLRIAVGMEIQSWD